MTIAAFLEAAGWSKATAAPLAGDASQRRYTRLTLGAQSAILMDAPMTTEAERANFTAFRAISTHLRTLGLSAPEEYHADADNGLLLLEDFGTESLSNLLEHAPDTAHDAYVATAQMLVGLKAAPPAGLPAPGASAMAQMAGLTFEFVPESDALRDDLLGALTDALTTHAAGPPVLSLRDVHADNLMWLPGRSGAARIGLLDFQDALLLPEGYDLASLLDDPRRDVPAPWRADLIAAHSTPARIATLSLQRNLRILGIFRRLATDLGKPGYAAFLPRTRTLIARAAQGVAPLQKPVADLLARTAHWIVP